MFGFIFTYLYWYFRPLIKWFLRRTTRLCELQRICYGEPEGAPRSLGVEFSLTYTKSADIKKVMQLLDESAQNLEFIGDNKNSLITQAAVTVLKVKRIKPTVHLQFPYSFGKCVGQIWGYRQLIVEIEQLRTTAFNSEDPKHEEKLMELWTRLMSEPLESRITKQWQKIGFQGDDPKTDFRGMGLLGLENLLYFAREYEGPAKHLLSHSYHPIHGYAFAIVGINLTSMAYYLVKEGIAKTHIYNASRYIPTLKIFHQLYCYLFYEFDKYWIESKPKNIMDFSIIREKFENNIRTELANKNTLFKINISIDNI